QNLRRFGQKGDRVMAHVTDLPHFVDRIPYVCLAFGTPLSQRTAGNYVAAQVAAVPSELQPEGFWVLDRFAIANVRTNEGVLRGIRDDGEPPVGTILTPSAERTLAYF